MAAGTGATAAGKAGARAKIGAIEAPGAAAKAAGGALRRTPEENAAAGILTT